MLEGNEAIASFLTRVCSPLFDRYHNYVNRLSEPIHDDRRPRSEYSTGNIDGA